MFKMFNSACLFHKYALIFLDCSNSAPHTGDTVGPKCTSCPLDATMTFKFLCRDKADVYHKRTALVHLFHKLVNEIPIPLSDTKQNRG